MAAELDIVAVGRLATLVDGDQFMPAAIERAHAAIRFHPNKEIAEAPIGLGAGAEKLA